MAKKATKQRRTAAKATPRSKPQPLRFAALIRVSTEKQERQGESLRTQHDQIAAAVAQLGGKIVKRYAGQEHATSGWERKQLEQLLKDAQKKPRPFDAVMVADASRWSRDNIQNETGLEHLKDCGVKFFTLNSEHDLWNPEARLFLAMASVINSYQAQTTAKKSLENRIARARKDGAPMGGSSPYARTWDKKLKKWSVDAAKKKLIQDVVKRYLAGESLAELANEIGMTSSGLHVILTERCGDTWMQNFDSDKLNIHEQVETKIPRLLSEATIEALKRQLAANRTWNHKPQKYRYVLSRMIFCAGCGSALSGQTAGSGFRYYRHWNKKPNCLGGWVNADRIEEEVLFLLFKMYGNPKAVRDAIEKATPNLEKINALFERREDIILEVEQIRKARMRVIDRLGDENFSDEEADATFARFKKRETKLAEKLEQISAELENQPDPESIRATADLVAKHFTKNGKRYTDAVLISKIEHANTVIEEMTWEDKRALAQQVFGGKTPDGRRMGVYVTKHPTAKRTWTFEMIGTFDNLLYPLTHGVVSESSPSTRCV